MLLKKAGFKSSIFNSLFLIAFLLVPSLATATKKIDINGIRYWSYPDYTRVVIDLSGEAEFTNKRLSNPDRLYFDIRGSKLDGNLHSNIPVKNGMLKSVRAGQFNENTVRVVLDLEVMTDYTLFTLEDPFRITIDIYGNKIFSGKTRIVLDPGHGGKDPGAIGPNNLYEKDVVLDIALKLKDILSVNSDLEVFLTRDSDVFIPLEERTAIANSKNADLFVSIHVNASSIEKVKGIETYLLNWTNDEEAMKVAARENQISLKKMKKMQEGRDILEIIKSDLVRENKRDESIKLANYVQRSLVSDLDKNYRDIVDLGVKQALFYVLLGAEMPSILVEVSFISNLMEEKLLRRDSYRFDLAKSIASGINKYMSLMPEKRTLAVSRISLDSRD